MKRLGFSLLSFFLFAWLFTACGLEALIGGSIDTAIGGPQPPEIKPVARLKGQVTGMASASLTIRVASAKIAEGATDGSGAFEIELPKDTDFSNLFVEASLGPAILKTLVPAALKEQTTDAGIIDITSTAATLLAEGLLSTKGLEVVNYPTAGLKIMLEQIRKDIDTQPAMKRFKKMVERLFQAASARKDGDQVVFQKPSYRASVDGKALPTVEQSALLLGLLGGQNDYCDTADGALTECKDGPETSTLPFDLALAEAFQAIRLPTCASGEKIRVVFTVTINPLAKDGNCTTIRQFRHAKRYGGTTCDQCKVYLTGGIHKDSGLTDPKTAQLLSNWEPNKLAMHDDGTNGDLVAGDGIWTLAFEMDAPRDLKTPCQTQADCERSASCIQGSCKKTLRLGYKYTYGLYGDIWGGTEEFPGNQRLLEIVDQNGDGFVARHDHFADETSNKDRVNTLQKKGVSGMICFVEPPASSCNQEDPRRNDADCTCKVDQDADGSPDTRERSTDWDLDCKPDGYRVFANVQPITQTCQ